MERKEAERRQEEQRNRLYSTTQKSDSKDAAGAGLAGRPKSSQVTDPRTTPSPATTGAAPRTSCARPQLTAGAAISLQASDGLTTVSGFD